ncbi:tRNA G18 (ribose-2'-O)-methylase SpoU [Zhihengliuella halotolerans]|uniref:tRNA G18 (Ribose-2'-O)-methylase SpoU n=2 Tax=Zhihengliuella halotolerans TaxID=370736 RepID=A0A4Q8AB58_9MICC|nr:tRNA G18 (ribose-2'-O)-methylase SpoU [Zhihengliuella halotolerans]
MIVDLTPADGAAYDPASDPRVADYLAMSDAALRQVADPAAGRYIAESTTVVRRAIAAGHTPRSFFLARKHVPALADLLEQFDDVPAYVGEPELLEAIAGFHLHRGALAAMQRPAALDLGTVLQDARRIAILEDIADHTNVGAIFRSAAALGIDAVLITPRCADPLYRRAIRVSMGTVFQIPWVRLGVWHDAVAHLRAAGFTLAALEVTDEALPVDDVAAQNHEKLALILGTEGAGVSAAALANSDLQVVIPMAAGVDSLNVAAASAVAFWELRAR